MTNKTIIEKIKSYRLKMCDGYKLTCEDKMTDAPTLLDPFQMVCLTEVKLVSTLGTLLHVRLFKDVKDRGNNQVAAGALKIIETFTLDYNNGKNQS